MYIGKMSLKFRTDGLLFLLQSISVLLVACNILCLLVDETAMPKGTRVK